MSRHGLGMLRHVFKILFLHRLGMLRHASLGFLTEVPHAAACALALPRIASFDFFLLHFARSSILLLEYHLQDKNTHKNAQDR